MKIVLPAIVAFRTRASSAGAVAGAKGDFRDTGQTKPTGSTGQGEDWGQTQVSPVPKSSGKNRASKRLAEFQISTDRPSGQIGQAVRLVTR